MNGAASTRQALSCLARGVQVNRARLAAATERATQPTVTVRQAGVALPDWVRSVRRSRSECELCGMPAATVWAGTGERLCWECCESKREAR